MKVLLLIGPTPVFTIALPLPLPDQFRMVRQPEWLADEEMRSGRGVTALYNFCMWARDTELYAVYEWGGEHL